MTGLEVDSGAAAGVGPWRKGEGALGAAAVSVAPVTSCPPASPEAPPGWATPPPGAVDVEYSETDGEMPSPPSGWLVSLPIIRSCAKPQH